MIARSFRRTFAPTALAVTPTIFVASLGTLGILAGCSSSPATADARGDSAKTVVVGTDSQPKANDVTLTPAQIARIHVAPVALSQFNGSVQTTGTVAFNGDRSTQVLAPVSGPITRILVNPGAYVHRGDALASVTSPDFASAISGYRKSLSAYKNAQRIADLDEQLFKNDAISRREVDQAQTDAASAAADRDAALEQIRALGVSEQNITAIRENRPGAMETQATIRAPIDGTVVEKLVNPGQLIQAGTTACFTIADLSSVWVMANVFETDVAGVSAGETATVSSGAFNDTIVGRVSYVGSLVDPGSKATQVRIVAPNPRGVLRRDMLVNVAIRSDRRRNALLVPTSAVLRDEENLPFVYVALPNDRFARRPIRIGSRSGDMYEITSGLQAGERIVIDGALFLQFEGSQ